MSSARVRVEAVLAKKEPRSLADELAASGRTSEHAQGAARAGSEFAKLG